MRHRFHALLILSLILSCLLVEASPALADLQIHVVQPGETLFRIALNYGVTVQAIQAANEISGYIIYAGQTLIIPDPNASAVQPVPQPSTGVHIVQRGETLFTIGL